MRMPWIIWPEAGGWSRPKLPRQVDNTSRMTAEQMHYLRSAQAPLDLTSRPAVPVPAAFRPSVLYRHQEGPPVAYRNYAPLPREAQSRRAQPYTVAPERRYVHALLQRYRQQAKPIRTWTPVYWHVFDFKSSRRLPVRPAVRFPTWNYAHVTEDEMVERARARAGLRRR